MPELPEVEITCRAIERAVIDRPIVSVNVYQPNLRWPVPDALGQTLTSQRFCQITRLGKMMLWHLGSDWVLLWHLGMSGTWRIEDTAACRKKHDHIAIQFQDGPVALYHDPRRFGFCALAKAGEWRKHRYLTKFGLDALDPSLTPEFWYKYLATGRSTVKAGLLDQSIIAGIGNIYANEILWHAKILPNRSRASLTFEECTNLHLATGLVLQAALQAGGSSSRDFYHPDGQPGFFSHAWQCYGRKDLPCAWQDCCGTIRKMEEFSRATYYCPIHQT